MVYVNSTNIISSLGFTTDENIKKISSGISGITILNNKNFVSESVPVSHINNKELERKFAEVCNFGDYTRFEKLLILSLFDSLQKSEVEIRDPRTALIISSTKGNIDLLEEQKKNEYHENRLHLWKSARSVADFFQHPNTPIVISNACISGVLALSIAKRLIDFGVYDHAAVVGADILSEFTLSGFLALKAVSTVGCKPFDSSRDGMTPGEGAGTIILTKNKNFAYEPKIILAGSGNSNDANHISGPSRTGEELSLSIDNALSEAGISEKNIDMISVHGTATSFNDESEAKAISISKMETVPVFGLKSYIGHTFGAAGILETVVAIESMKSNEIFANLRYENHGVSVLLNISVSKKQIPINSVLKTASGFGGVNAALVLKKLNKVVDNELKSENISNLILTKSVILRGNHISEDGFNVFLHENFTDFTVFAKDVYKHFEINYPKFYKMDNLCKTAFLTSEILLKGLDISKKYNSDEIAIILSNGSSSSDTDSKYYKTIKERDNYFPSPSVFVYTLANIMAGEICIRNGIKGENIVFISEKFDINFIQKYTEIVFKSSKTKAAIVGRVEFEYPHTSHEAVLYFVEKVENINEKTIFDSQNMTAIYKIDN